MNRGRLLTATDILDALESGQVSEVDYVSEGSDCDDLMIDDNESAPVQRVVNCDNVADNSNSEDDDFDYGLNFIEKDPEVRATFVGPSLFEWLDGEYGFLCGPDIDDNTVSNADVIPDNNNIIPARKKKQCRSRNGRCQISIFQVLKKCARCQLPDSALHGSAKTPCMANGKTPFVFSWFDTSRSWFSIAKLLKQNLRENTILATPDIDLALLSYWNWIYEKRLVWQRQMLIQHYIIPNPQLMKKADLATPDADLALQISWTSINKKMQVW